MVDEEIKEIEETKIEGKKIEEISPIEEAKNILVENAKMLEEIRKERLRIEKATAEMLISGRSYAGQVTKQETEDEKWAREAKIRYAGTGMDPTP